MQITREADYATRAVLHLARLEPGTRVPTARLAAEAGVPPAFLAKIVAQLAAVSVLRTTRGAHGGVALARPAAEISLLAVVEALGQTLLLNLCADDPRACPLGAGCSLQSVWAEARHDVQRRLGAVSFAALAARQRV